MEKRYIKMIIGIIIMAILLSLTACQPKIEEIRLESGKIAFISSRNEKLELFMVDVHGKDIDRLLTINEQIVDMAINPNLKYIIIETAEKTNNDLEGGALYLYDLEEKRKILIDKNGSYPSWSPDGEKIVYNTITDEYKEAIIITGPLLRNKKVLFYNKEYSIPWGLSWSPDGSELLFYKPYLYHKPGDIASLYRYIIAEEEFKQIKLKNTYNLYNAAWSPVERIIAAGIYDSELKKYTLALIEPDTGNVTHLTTVENNLYLELEWSPDGKNILFTAYEVPLLNFRGTWPWSNDSTDIFVYDIENDEIRNLTKSDSTDYRPQWIP